MKYNIFISHKSEDEAIASVLKKCLEDLSQFKLNIHISGKMHGGVEWRNWIEKTILASHYLIFLYTSVGSEKDWNWCVYELGLFHGKRAKEYSHNELDYENSDLSKNHYETDIFKSDTEIENSKVICIKHPAILKPPSQIENIQVINADPEGIKKLFTQLVYEGGSFCEDSLISPVDQVRFPEAVDKFVDSFRHTVEIEFFTKRMVVTLKDNTERTITEKDLDVAQISGNEETMEFLNIPRGMKNWKELYESFKANKQSAWLDQVRESIEWIQKNKEPHEVMQPFINHVGKRIIPIISRVETSRVTEGTDTIIKPKELALSFVPIHDPPPPSYQLDDMSHLTTKWTTYPPTSIVKISWERLNGNIYRKEDIQSAVVCSANESFAQLWDFTYQDFLPNLDDDPARRLTDPILFESIKNYIEPDHLAKFMKDQERLFERIVIQRKDAIAEIPLQFNDRHPREEYKNQAYLPYLISKHLVGDVSGEHEMYLLVCYIRDFWPIGYNEKCEHDASLRSDPV